MTVVWFAMLMLTIEWSSQTMIRDMAQRSPKKTWPSSHDTMKTQSHICLLAASLTLALATQAQNRVRTPINIPDIPGYMTLKCDFHVHTVFSDGSVWPNVRPEEAWRNGLDAIAITDHIEYHPHKDDLPTKHNRAYEIAKPHGDALDVIVIRGSEITRSMPPGHLNAVFLEDAAPLETTEWRDAVLASVKQGAFIFWNHPGWESQQPDGIARWYAEHDELATQNALHGIEVVNGDSYYPEAHRWCLDKKLAIMCNSDIHAPIGMEYDASRNEHRPVTLVFATNRAPAAIKDALLNRRTAAYAGNKLVGEEQFLRPIFEKSVRIVYCPKSIKGRNRVYVQVHNGSDISYELKRTRELEDVAIPASINLMANRTSLIEVRGRGITAQVRRSLALPYRVDNLLVSPNQGLDITLAIDIELLP